MMVCLYPQLMSSESDKFDEDDASFYRTIIGFLLFAASCLRYDICFALGWLICFLQTPGGIIPALLNKFSITQNLNSLSITYGTASESTFVGISDSDLSGDISDRKSVSGNLFLIFGKPVTWSSKKQASVSLLSCETA